ncbi:MAG: hypothetical protein ACK41Y_16880 [Paracoccus hibiscisoli]|uniref:hypothetical protein n=1 Tax=Paracoccus hibiscisoli TaxID=2023261 RepID=UPI00391B20A7
MLRGIGALVVATLLHQLLLLLLLLLPPIAPCLAECRQCMQAGALPHAAAIVLISLNCQNG